jgi:uncharacterized membrane-anchored protein
MTPRKGLIAGLVAVGLLQTIVLATMVAGRVLLLRTGQEIVLPIVPVDPRDLFRGEYVRLSYPISRLEASLLEGPAPRDGRFYVTLERAADGWKPVRITAAPPAAPGPDRIVLAARAPPYARGAFAARTGTVFVQYGIERYFVPEGQGLALETLARDRKLSALVAVGGGGQAALKGLMIEGQRVYSEPLF